jgi:nucleoid-associated protein YgaU
MSKRYNGTYIVNNARKEDSDGKVRYIRRLSTVFYPNFSKAEDTQILSQEGDRLDIIAKEYYGDESLWFVIAKVNNLGKGSLNIPAGTILRVPYYQEDTGIVSLLNNYNSWR